MIVGLVKPDGRIKKILARQDLNLEWRLSGTVDRNTGHKLTMEVYLGNLKVVVTRADYLQMKKFFNE